MAEPAIDTNALIECYGKDPRMTPQKWVEWACDCAERVLPLFQAYRPDNVHPAQALAVTRRWIANPTKENARAAADAARAAAYAADTAYAADAADAAAAADTARAAADATAYAAYAAYAAADTAYAAYAAADAARAAYAAARAADAAERLWQAVRLMEVYHA